MKATLLMAGAAGLFAASAAWPPTGPIRIGVPVGSSGANSVVAPSVVQAAQLAVDEINAKGGVLGRQVKLEVADDGSGAAGAQKAFDSLIFQKKVNVAHLDGDERRAQRRPADRGRAARRRTSTRRFTKATPATVICTSMPGCPTSRSRRSSTTS